MTVLNKVDLHNPKAKRAIIEHLKFAHSCVTEAFGEMEGVDFSKKTVKMDLNRAIEQQAIIYILQLTIGLDARLKNTIAGFTEDQLKDNEKFEDYVL